jgi:endonuclease/exonuclease/phosphatase family metal-dependent hydrolase
MEKAVNSLLHRAAAFGLLLSLSLASSASALRVVTYNLLNYSSGRVAEFETVLTELEPDVLLAQEVLSQSAVNNFLATVLDDLEPGEWAAGPFVDGTDTDNAVFYRITAVQHLSHYVISTSLRDIDEWTVRPVGYDAAAANLRIYVVHLKASQGYDNQQRRLQEVTAMRTRLETFPAGENYIVLGDFNIYTYTEPAYQYLLSTTPGLAGVVEDPLEMPGNWHDNASFAAIHSQSPRTTDFGGGAIGGMDDRFDMILVGPALRDGSGFDVLADTYKALGQDGLHFNVALIDPPENAVVSAEVAQALHDASDHLPVVADFQLPARVATDPTVAFGTVIVDASAAATLSVSNAAPVPADDLDYSLAAPAGFSAPAGPFTAAAGAPANEHSLGMDTQTRGVKTGDLVLASNDLDDPTLLIPLSGTVLGHARPSVTSAAEVSADTLDFGVHPVGGFPECEAAAYNYAYDSLQAALDVYEAELTGDPRFALGESFLPATVTSDPAFWSVCFEDAGAEEGMYTGTLILRTRDEAGLPGGTELSALSYALVATVGDGVAVGELPPTTRLGLARLSPNPFRDSLALAFGVRRPGSVVLQILDVRGCRVRTLVDGTKAAGSHTVLWDGRDGQGRELAAGIYFVRLVTPDLTQTKRIVRVR